MTDHRPHPNVKRLDSHTGSAQPKHFKSTLFETPHLLLGVNCLEPGQSQPVHTHADQDKAYMVQSGSGRFTVGEARLEGGPGDIVWAPAGEPHGVDNTGVDRLVLLVAIAPGPRAHPG